MTIDMETSSGSNLSISSTFATVSDDERRRYLDALQARDNRLLIPTVIFLSTVAVVGLFGNSLVLLAYSRKVRRNATDVFIMAIAAFDLLTNVVALPNEIYDTFHYWDFDTPSQCRLRVYVNAFTTMTSALALLAVAVTRYKKICRPFGKQTSLQTAKIMSLLIAAACSLCAIPQPILYGLKTRKTARPDIVGHECDIADEYLDTVWPMLFASFLMLLFMLVYIPLIVLYVLVGIQAWKHSRRHGVSVIARSQSTSENIENTLNSDNTKNTDNTLNSDDVTVTNVTTISTPRRSLGLSLFKKGDKYKSSHESDGSSREEIHELGRKEHVKDEVQSCGNPKKHSSAETDDCVTNVIHLHPSDTEDTKSTEFQRLPFANGGEVCGDNDCAEEERDTGQGNERSQFKTSFQSPKVDQLPIENEEVGDCRRQEYKSQLNGEAIKEANSCEKIHLSRFGLTKSGKSNAEDLRDVNTDNNNTSQECRSDERENNCTISQEDDDDKIRDENNHTVLSVKSRKSKSKLALHKKGHTRRVLNRTTLMLIIITSVYVIGFLPYLVLISLKFTSPLFYENLSAAGESLYNVFLRFFFINSAANAIIYSICDPRFRLEIVKIFKCQKYVCGQK